MTTVSAVIPTFNRAQTLARALASVFAQSRPPDEVLVVDDRSTDGTPAVVREFPQARLIALDRNGGAGRARNEGVRQATGKWIAFLDSDDAWHREKLERQLARVAAAPGIDLLCTGVTVHERGGRIDEHRGATPRAPAGWTFADFQAYPFCPTTWLIRRDMFLDAGRFDETLRNAEDLDFLARIARRRIEVLPQPLATKHNRGDSLDAGLERTADSYRILFERHAGLWAQAPDAAARSCRRLANMYITQGRLPEARRALVQGLRYWPWDYRSWILLGLSPLGGRGYTMLRRLAR